MVKEYVIMIVVVNMMVNGKMISGMDMEYFMEKMVKQFNIHLNKGEYIEGFYKNDIEIGIHKKYYKDNTICKITEFDNNGIPIKPIMVNENYREKNGNERIKDCYFVGEYNNNNQRNGNGIQKYVDENNKSCYQLITYDKDKIIKKIEIENIEELKKLIPYVNKMENVVNEEKYKCKICYDNDFECLFLNCKHLVCCMECSKKLTECPICREKIEEKINIKIC